MQVGSCNGNSAPRSDNQFINHQRIFIGSKKRQRCHGSISICLQALLLVLVVLCMHFLVFPSSDISTGVTSAHIPQTVRIATPQEGPCDSLKPHASGQSIGAGVVCVNMVMVCAIGKQS